MNFKFWPLLVWLVIGCGDGESDKPPTIQYPDPANVLKLINKVNQYWQETHPHSGNAFWDEAAYHTGNMEVYLLTGNPDYKSYSERWAEKNEWRGAGSDLRKQWKYSYGETAEHVLFGDWQICFQTYVDLYNLDSVKQPHKIARAREVMEYEMNTPQSDYLWWADGLYMVMPVMTKLYKVTGNELYLKKLYEYFDYAHRLMYDPQAQLYYRDAKYVFPKHKTVHGKKDFWARGNGWVVAALAKTLTDLPQTDPHRQKYLDTYMAMAARLVALQQPEGYWTRSMMDEAYAPGPETSGTAFFTYGLLWGIRNGYLNKKEYLPAVWKAWDYLVHVAVQPEGKIGYVQPIGERAIPGQIVDRHSTANFGVGAFLLAAAEMYKFLK